MSHIDRPAFNDVVVLTDDVDKLVIVPITSRGDGKFSFSFMRVFETAEGLSRTNWLFRRHLPAMRRLLDKLEQQLLIEEEKVKLEALKKRAATTPGGG